MLFKCTVYVWHYDVQVILLVDLIAPSWDCVMRGWQASCAYRCWSVRRRKHTHQRLICAASNCVWIAIAKKCHLIQINVHWSLKSSAINPGRVVVAPKHLNFILSLAVKRHPLRAICVNPLNCHCVLYLFPRAVGDRKWKVPMENVASFIYILKSSFKESCIDLSKRTIFSWMQTCLDRVTIVYASPRDMSIYSNCSFTT